MPVVKQKQSMLSYMKVLISLLYAIHVQANRRRFFPLLVFQSMSARSGRLGGPEMASRCEREYMKGLKSSADC